MNPFRRAILAALIMVGVAAMTGCSTVTTAPDQVALHYKGEPLSSTAFANCVQSSTRDIDGPSDPHYYYPAGLRTYKFTGGNGADDDPIQVATKNGVELTTTGFVSFRLNTDCTEQTINGKKYPGGILQYFHEQVGAKNWGGGTAYVNGDDYNGWDNMLDIYIGQPLRRAINDASQGLEWMGLYNDPAVKKQWEADVKAKLPAYIKQATGADFFTIDSVSIQKPVPPQGIIDGLAAKQKAVLENDAQLARNAKITTELDGIQEQIRILGPHVWLQKYAIDSGKVTILPVPQGSNISVAGK